MLRTTHYRTMAVALGFAASIGFGCSQEPITVPLRSLEPGGDISFLCMSSAGTPSGTSQQKCGQELNPSTQQYDDLFALVTQPVRGEVALINLTQSKVVDLNQSKPGYNFIPVGAHPGAITSTPGSTATFVGSSQAGHEGIWILPSKVVLAGEPTLTSFAECALPSAPGDMKVTVQVVDEKDLPATDDALHPNGDVARESLPLGPRKLLVSLPDQGAVAVIDAQTLVDLPAGSFQACPIDKWIPLTAALPAVSPQQQVPPGGFPPGVSVDGSVCEMTALSQSERPVVEDVRPGYMALDEHANRLYVTDEQAPVIHVLDITSPTDAREIDPLLPVSVDEPWRVVTTRRLAVSPTTLDGKKFLYATDLHRGSVMTFDVSEGATDRTPLIHDYPTLRPFEPKDRLSFAVPVRDVSFVVIDEPVEDPNTGVLTTGQVCDPEHDSAHGSSYRASEDRTDGAGPGSLRGVFAVVALTNGQFVIVDVDDFDAACRRPKTSGACPSETFQDYHGATGELSCMTVERHEARSKFFYEATSSSQGRVPGLQAYPSLTLNGGVLATDQSDDGKLHPKMLVPNAPGRPVIVGNRSAEKAESDPEKATISTVMFDYREPRVHFDQDWSVVYEGAIPGFGGHFGRFVPKEKAGLRHDFLDGGVDFCANGVHDLDATRAVGERLGIHNSPQKPHALDDWARKHVDVLEVTSDFLGRSDPYWDSVAGQCSWLQCRETFGLVEDPKTTRDFPILEARQNKLLVDGVSDFLKCCFPTMPSYTVRPSGQWVVRGSVSGFVHKVDVDRKTGRCVDSCDPQKDLLNARAFPLDIGHAVPGFDDPWTFKNPSFRFVVWNGAAPAERGSIFAMQETGGFVPLMINLAAVTPFVAPQQMRQVPSTGEIAVADGATQGLVLLDIGSLSVSRSFQ